VVKNLRELRSVEIGMLRGGYWVAAQTALAMLVARGLLVTGPPGRIRRTGVAPTSDHVLERALFSDLYGTMGAKELANQPHVRQVLDEIQSGLLRAGLLRRRWVRILLPVALVTGMPGVVARMAALGVIGPRLGVLLVLVSVVLALWFMPRRTWSGAQALRRLREQHKHLKNIVNDCSAAGHATDPDVVGLGVALFGRSALLAFLPTAAADAGLLDGGRWTRRLDFPEAQRGRYG
jgi:uncharacterized protein (TIGR04222 family)